MSHMKVQLAETQDDVILMLLLWSNISKTSIATSMFKSTTIWHCDIHRQNKIYIVMNITLSCLSLQYVVFQLF